MLPIAMRERCLMSNELLATLQATWNGLSPEVQAIVTGAAGQLAGTLTANVISN